MRLLFVCSAPAPLPTGAAVALQKIWRDISPDCVFFGGGSGNEELAARLSVCLDVRCITGATSVAQTGDGFDVTRRVFGGELTAEYHVPAPCLIVLDRELPADGLYQFGEVTDLEPEYTAESWYDGFDPIPDDAACGLKSVKKIIAAGRGIGSRAQFGMIRNLAGRLGAAAGATRPVVMNGWAPMGAQVGVSGVSVDPEIILIIASSGAEAFLAGVGRGATIIAVNSDPGAAIFRRADWGVVGDGNEILRELLSLTEKECVG